MSFPDSSKRVHSPSSSSAKRARPLADGQLVNTRTHTNNDNNEHSNTRDPVSIVLSGHTSTVTRCLFSPFYPLLSSASYDRSIRVWRMGEFAANAGNREFPDEFVCLADFRGHKGPVLGLDYNIGGSLLFSCSSDSTVAVWDLEAERRRRKCRGHQGAVNDVSRQRMANEDGYIYSELCSRDPLSYNGGLDGAFISAADDGSCISWDSRTRIYAHRIFHPQKLPLTCVAQLDELIWYGGLDNLIHCVDQRTNEILYTLTNHKHTITGLALNHQRTHLISTGMDSAINSWDIRPFVSDPSARLSACFSGLLPVDHNNHLLVQSRWSPDDRYIVSGAADNTVGIIETFTGALTAKLTGHGGPVVAVDWHPSLPLVASGGMDKNIIVGELGGSSKQE